MKMGVFMIRKDVFLRGIDMLQKTLNGGITKDSIEIYYKLLHSDFSDNEWLELCIISARNYKFFPRPAELLDLKNNVTKNWIDEDDFIGIITQFNSKYSNERVAWDILITNFPQYKQFLPDRQEIAQLSESIASQNVYISNLRKKYSKCIYNYNHNIRKKQSFLSLQKQANNENREKEQKKLNTKKHELNRQKQDFIDMKSLLKNQQLQESY